ncbi:MAG: ASPIC/UnbV domain-containing protein, partial [Halobacteriaceae archaeon]
VADSPEKRLQANLNPDAQRRTPYRLYENVGAGPNALVLRLRNPGGLTTGARVTVEFEDGETVVAANAKAGFLAQDGDTLHVGLGDRSVERLRVRWPDGTVRSYDDLPAATHLTVAPDGVTAWRPDA